MKIIGRLLLFLLLVIIIIPVLVLGYLGFIPGLSSLFGSNRPRNLGVTYTQADLTAGRAKSQIVYEQTATPTSPSQYWQTSGSRPVSTDFSSAEVTAIMNNKPGAYYPYRDVQVKFNADGTAEISCAVDKSRLPTYAATFGAPQVAVDFAMKFLPANPVFYLKGKATLVDNRVGVFEPMRFEIGRAPMPLSVFLAAAPKQISEAYAIDISSMTEELNKVDNKRALIIDFINSRLSAITGFFAKSAYFEADKLHFDGTLPEKESTVR